MELVSDDLIEQYAPLQVTPQELLEGESLVDLGDAAPMYTKMATEITASGG